LWLVALCNLVEVYRRFKGACCPHHQDTHCHDDGGSKYLLNVGKLKSDCIAQQATRQLLIILGLCLTLEKVMFSLPIFIYYHS
jgi:hypothetical protein